MPPSSAVPHTWALHSSSLQPAIPKAALADPPVPHPSTAMSPVPAPAPAVLQRGRDTQNNPGTPEQGPMSEPTEKRVRARRPSWADAGSEQACGRDVLWYGVVSATARG